MKKGLDKQVALEQSMALNRVAGVHCSPSLPQGLSVHWAMSPAFLGLSLLLLVFGPVTGCCKEHAVSFPLSGDLIFEDESHIS